MYILNQLKNKLTCYILYRNSMEFYTNFSNKNQSLCVFGVGEGGGG